jgi:hypothetical protein
MNQTFTLQLEDEKTLSLTNPKLKGLKGANILSQILDYKNSCVLNTAQPNQVALIELCTELDINLTDLDNSNQEIQDNANAKIQDAVLKNPRTLEKIFGGVGDVKILFSVITDILDYYSITDITADDFTKSDIFEVIKWLKSEPKNDIQDFLGITEVKM